MHPKAVIFDMDGVLVDTEPLYMEAEKRVSEKFGIHVPDEAFSDFKGKSNHAIFSYIVNHFGNGRVVDIDDMVLAKRSMLMEMDPTLIRLFPGVCECLEYVKQKIGKVALTTTSRKFWQERIFAMTAIPSVFDVIITGDDVVEGRGKPDPLPYRITTDALGVSPEQSLVIEDSRNGVLSASGAGCRVVGITTSFDPEALISGGADHIVHSLGEIQHLI